MDSKIVEMGENKFELKKMSYGDRLGVTDKSMSYDGLSFSKEEVDKLKKGLEDKNKKDEDFKKIGIKVSQKNLQLYTILYSLKNWKKGEVEIPIKIENISNLSFDIGSKLFTECQDFNSLGEAEEKNS